MLCVIIGMFYFFQFLFLFICLLVYEMQNLVTKSSSALLAFKSLLCCLFAVLPSACTLTSLRFKSLNCEMGILIPQRVVWVLSGLAYMKSLQDYLRYINYYCIYMHVKWLVGKKNLILLMYLGWFISGQLLNSYFNLRKITYLGLFSHM